MRDILLMRHGRAEDHASGGDRARNLTEVGRAEVAQVAAALKRLEVHVDAIWHSPYTRAVQTMEIVSEALGEPPRVEDAGLVPNAMPETAVDALMAASGTILVVAHLPILPAMANVILRAPLMLNYAPASVVHMGVLGRGQAMLHGFHTAGDLVRLSR